MTEAENDSIATSTNAGLVPGLLKASAFPHQVSEITMIETHISWVFLAGDYAYKLKKAVDFGFLDFTNLEKRRFACAEELRLNRRLAKSIYLDVVTITGTQASPQVAGEGPLLDYAVKMHRFASGCLLSDLIDEHKITLTHIDQLAESVAEFHGQAQTAMPSGDFGNPKIIRAWFEENFTCIESLCSDQADLLLLKQLQNWGNRLWHSRHTLMENRLRQGYIKECHGDLHLGNLVLINDQVIAFDCIEFNEQLRFIDVISEVAFLTMDLIHRGQIQFAYRFLNRYLQHTGDYESLGLLPYYWVYRALVRAKITLLDSVKNQEQPPQFNDYLNTAAAFIAPTKPCLLITFGYSGSGKSTMAAKLADSLQLICIRSDLERKRMLGFAAFDDTGSSIGQGAYTAEITERLFQSMAKHSINLIQAGFSVIIDAAFLQKRQRDLFRDLAAEQGAAFAIIACNADVSTLEHRIKQRSQQGNDPSEATIAVLQGQLSYTEEISQDETAVVAINTEFPDAFETLQKQLKHLLKQAEKITG